jgi:outer membrane protein OmpA-like peptidoglycan-associated protein/Tol biopolymer transport system component
MNQNLAFILILLTWAQQAICQVNPAVDDSLSYYVSTQKIVPGISREGVTEYAPSISADGKTMIFEASQGTSYKLYESNLENGNWSAPHSLDNINSFGDSTGLIGGPSISFDGNTLYFFGSFKGSQREDIYVSYKNQEGWSVPENIGAPINSAGYEAFPSISVDGSTLYFIRENLEGPQDKELKKLNQACYSIYRSFKDADGNWGMPQKLPSPINQECEKAPKIMADGKTLIFSSNRMGGKGSYDMYQSKKNVLGEWSLPRPLDYVNTAKSDQLPCISAEGDLMYYVFDNQDIYTVEIPPSLRQFMNNVIQGKITDQDTGAGIAASIIVTDALTSETVMNLSNNPATGDYSVVLPVGRNFNIEVRKEGFSNFTMSYDLRKVHKYQETKRDIALFQTVNLSLNINDVELFEAIGADVKVRVKGQSSYFKELKNNPKTGLAVISLPIGQQYEISVDAENFKGAFFTFGLADLVMYRGFEKEVELIPEKEEVMINVSDLVNNMKVKSKIILRNKNRDEYIEVTGNEMVSLRKGDRYEIEATSDQGYAFNSTSLEVGSGKNEISMKLLKLEKDARLALKDITFESNSANLTDVSFVELSRVIELMKENPNLKVEIDAHTDDVGSDRYNLILSDKRAGSVMSYLVGNNIPVERFLSKGFGEKQPKVPNDSEENRASNRRVELRILSI